MEATYVRCLGRTKKNTDCQKRANESGYCKTHDPAIIQAKVERCLQESAAALRRQQEYQEYIDSLAEKTEEAKEWLSKNEIPSCVKWYVASRVEDLYYSYASDYCDGDGYHGSPNFDWDVIVE